MGNRSSANMLRIVSLCLCLALAGASVEDEWSESTDTIDLPEMVMAELPLSTHSKSPAGHLLAFDADKYDYLKMVATEADELKFDSFVQIPGAANAKLHLKKLEVFTEDAKLTNVNENGVEETMERPDVLHMHGTVDGDENSKVLLNLSPHGTTGFIHTSDEKFLVEMLHDDQAHAVVTASADEPSDDEKKAMAANSATDTLAAPAGAGAFEGDGQPDSDPDNLMLVDAGKTKTTDSELEVAIECDKKCMVLLADKGGSQTYLASVIAGVSQIYSSDLGRSMKISNFRNWAGTSPFDQGTASLDQLVSYYKNKMYGKEKYDVGHLFTGIREGGLAYVGTVCAGSRGVNTGVSSIQGTWKNDGYKSKSSYNWDLIVSAHELGHNMGSGHSHDYGGSLGPIDECVACPKGTTGSCGGSAAKPVSRNDARCVVGTIMSYCHLCGGTANVKMQFHPRAITKIKANLNSRCGTVTEGSSNPAPTPTPATPAPAPTTSGSSGSCTAKASLGKCEKCQTTDQCQGNGANGGTWYCCPYMKKCVETSSMPCYTPIANCRPMCYDTKVSTCVCEGGKKFSTMGWGKPTCSGSSGGSSGGGSKPSPPARKPTKSPIATTAGKDTQSWCPRYAKYCAYRMTVGRGTQAKTQAMRIWCPATCADK